MERQILVYVWQSVCGPLPINMLMKSIRHKDSSVIDALGLDSPLLVRMVRCGTPSQSRHTDFCRRVGCSTCRIRYARHQVAKATKRFGGAAPGEFANARITIGTTDLVGDIGPMFETARTKLRNIIDQQRAARSIWHDVEVLGWMRVGLAAGSPPDKPRWAISTNLLVRHGTLPYQGFGHALAEGWKSPGQTCVEPFDPAILVQESLARIIQHATAPWHPSCDGNGAWPKEWISGLYGYVDGWSRSFQSLRIDIGPRDAKLTRHTPYAHVADEWIEPMPVIVGNDDFSTIRYPWA